MKFDISVQKNIQNYAAAVLLSSKIATYKGATPTNHILVGILYILVGILYIH